MKIALYIIIIFIFYWLLELNGKVYFLTNEIKVMKQDQAIKNAKYDNSDSYMRTKYYEIDNRLLQMGK